MRFSLFFILLIWSFWVSAQSKDVLVVHSYHQGFFWTDNFQKGLATELDRDDIPYRVVYLDSKRAQSEEYFDKLYQLYRTKLANEEFSAVVVSDNNALNLMKRLAPELNGTPVVFGGINNYSPSMTEGLKATGITEDIDLNSNITLIQRLQPMANKIYIVSDFSVTGEAVRAQVDRHLDHYPQHASFIEHYQPRSYRELVNFAQQADMSKSLLFWVYYRDEKGNVSNDDDWRELNKLTKMPIYMVHDLGLGFGAIGGVIQSGLSQGRETGLTLRRMLANPDQELPPVVEGAGGD